MCWSGYQSAVVEAALGVGSFVFRGASEADLDLRAEKRLVAGDNPFVPGFEHRPQNAPNASTAQDRQNGNPLSRIPSRAATNCIFGSKNGIPNLSHAPPPRQPSIPINSTLSDQYGTPNFSRAWKMRENLFTKFSAVCPSCEIKAPSLPHLLLLPQNLANRLHPTLARSGFILRRQGSRKAQALLIVAARHVGGGRWAIGA